MTNNKGCTVHGTVFCDVATEELVIIATGTPCNVTVHRDGVYVDVWNDTDDSPHAALKLTWAEIIARAVAL